MIPTEHPAKMPSTETGLFATLAGLLRTDGSRAPASRLAASCLGLALLFVGLIVPPGTSADQTRLLETSFGPDGTTASHFEQPAAVGIDRSTGATYVADYAAGTVQKFNAAHEPAAFTGSNPAITAGKLTGFSFFTTEPESELAVNSSSHDFYVVNNGDKSLHAFQADGEPAEFSAGPGAGTNVIGPFPELCGVAVDSNGAIYASDFSTGVHVYAPSGAELTTFTGLFACNVAVDSNGTVYRNRFEGPVEKFTPSEFPVTSSTTYAEAGTVDENPAWGVAVDPASNHLFVDEHTRLAEYDEAGARLASFAASGSGALSASEGLAVDASGHPYVSDAGGERQVEVFGPAVVLPDVTTEAATPIGPTTATLNGSVNPAGVEVTECFFEYVDDAHYEPNAPNPYSAGQTESCAETVGSGTSPVSVHADISGLIAGVTYHFRLLAANANGQNQGADETLETPPPPSIDAAAAINVTETSADLTAEVNPKGTETSCQIEWGETTEAGNHAVPYEHTEPCNPANLGAGNADVPVSVHLEGLTPNTTYHWRLLATNPSGTSKGFDHTFIYLTETPIEGNCPNQAFRTGPSAALPDCRAYEQVTPPAKNAALLGAVILGLLPDFSEDGQHLVLSSVQCFGGAVSCIVNRGPVGTQFAFDRTDAGWQTTPLAPPATEFDVNTIWSVNAESGFTLFSAPTPPAGEDDLYARRPNGSILHIGPVTSPSFGAQGFVGAQGTPHMATSDLSRVVYEEASAQGRGLERYWPFDETSSTAETVYEYAGAGNAHPFLLGVSGGPESTDLISTCGTTLATPLRRPGALSADGRTVYFTAVGAPGCFGSGANAGTEAPADALYARLDGETPDAETVATSERSPTECHGECTSSPPSDANFQGASLDGSLAYFTSTQQLTDEASEDSHPGDTAFGSHCTETTGPGGCNLYLYDFARPEGQRLIDVSAGDSSGPGVQGVVALSDDGSHVYFLANGVLAPGAGPGNCRSVQEGTNSVYVGACNLYLYQRDAAHPGGQLAFIAALPASDNDQGNAPKEWSEGPRLANVSPDGRFLVFPSQAALTADTAPTGVTQLFRYDAQTAQLLRLSIGARGFNDNGNSPASSVCISASCPDAVRIVQWEVAPPGRSDPTMSDDGSRVFFTSPIALTPGALAELRIGTDERGNPIYAQNVYEWEAQGKGGCAEASGCVRLISDGRDASSAGSETCGAGSAVCLIGASTSGADVFFTTGDPLVSQDSDTQLDFYDARVGGGFAETAGTTPCQSSEACHQGGTGEGSNASPATPGFNGPEEGPKHRRCAKGFVKRHSRCAKKHVRKHHKRRHHRRAAGNHRRASR